METDNKNMEKETDYAYLLDSKEKEIGYLKRVLSTTKELLNTTHDDLIKEKVYRKVETDAKNQLYLFLMLKGYEDEFITFKEDHPQEKAFNEVQSILMNKVPEEGRDNSSDNNSCKDIEPYIETYLNETSIRELKRMFKDENTYIKHMETLWVLRALALKKCERNPGGPLSYDKENPTFRIADTMNQLIGCLLQDINFSFDGEKVLHWE